MKTAITELLNIEYPIVQGAMAWVADADLASAVSNAGGCQCNVIEPTCGRSGRLLNRIWRQNHYHWCR